MNLRILGVLSCLVLNSIASQGVNAAVVTLTAPPEPVPAGSQVRCELLVANSSAEAVTYSLPTALDGRIVKGDNVWLVNIRGGASDITVPARGFVVIPLDFPLPLAATGQIILELGQPARLRTVLDVREAASAVAVRASGLDSAVPNTESNLQSLPGASRLKRASVDHFSVHEPMYFLFGSDKPAVKFQLSLKYRLLDDHGPWVRRYPALHGLNLAYTQRSLWDITSASSPFYDSSYMPEFLFESLAPDDQTHGGFHWLGYQAAFQHESNGRDGAASRSLNIFYFRPMIAFGDLDGWRLILRPKLFAYIGGLGDNADLRKYRGYSELRAIFGKNNRLSVSLTGRIGEGFKHGSAQLDVSYPAQFLTGNFSMYLHVQYWNGYGESLLRYNLRTETVRAGFSIAR